jgi:hypothetical protein
VLPLHHSADLQKRAHNQCAVAHRAATPNFDHRSIPERTQSAFTAPTRS